MIRISETPFDPSVALAEFLKRAGEGAVASFVGIVREDGDVRGLTIDQYPGFTARGLEQIARAVQDRHRLTAVEIVHRVGPMKPGDPIVFAATSAPRRRSALDALDELMDRLKTDAPLWKQEQTSSGERWVEPTPDDHSRREQWNSHD